MNGQPSLSSSRQQTRAAYDRLSRVYDWLAASSERPAAAAGLKRLDVRPGETVLELGSGTGSGLLALSSAVGEAGRVYGVDLSPAMCRVAQSKLGAAGQAVRALLSNADAVRLPLRGDSVDALLLSFTLELFGSSEIPSLLAECRRVLRPGGRLAVVALSASARPGLMERLYVWAHRHFPQWVDCRPIAVRTWLEEAGFRIADALELSMWGLPVAVVLAHSEPTIRPVAEDELDAVLAVYCQCEDFLALGPQPRASMDMVRADLALSRQAGGTFCGIFDAGGTMLGVVDYVPRAFEGRPDHAYLSLLMIARPYRGRGLGEEVVHAVEARIARDPRISTVKAGVQVNNPAALRFWQHMGYCVTGGPEAMPDGTTVFHLRKELGKGSG